MTETPVDLEAALLYYRQQAVNLSPPASYGISNWAGRCQQLAHTAYGLFSGGFATAYLQWLGADSEDRHVTTDLSQGPVGSFLCTKGSNPAGHIFGAAHPFASGLPGGWSNDIVETGHVDKVDRNAPRDHWGHRNLGWITSINGFALDLTHGAPPKPKQNKRYQRVENAIMNLHHSKETAKSQHDKHDVDAIDKEIERLKVLYSKLRHS
jgi:hypothetical protein